MVSPKTSTIHLGNFPISLYHLKLIFKTADVAFVSCSFTRFYLSNLLYLQKAFPLPFDKVVDRKYRLMTERIFHGTVKLHKGGTLQKL